jgi:hypothetical protein
MGMNKEEKCRSTERNTEKGKQILQNDLTETSSKDAHRVQRVRSSDVLLGTPIKSKHFLAS